MKINHELSSFLDLARWIAALFVFIGHLRYVLFVDYDFVQEKTFIDSLFYFITGLGHDAVMVFFVLSGLLIVDKAKESTDSKSKFINYSISRFSRIYVVFLPALVMTFILDYVGWKFFNSHGIYTSGYDIQAMLFNAHIHLGWDIFLSNIFMLQNLATPPLGSNGPLWSINYEFFYYFLFPLLIISISRKYYFILTILISIILFVMYLRYEIFIYFGIWLIGYYGVQNIRFKRWKKIHLLASICLLSISLFVSRLHIIPLYVNDYMSASSFIYLICIIRDSKLKFGSFLNQFLASFSYSLYLFHFSFMIFLIAILQSLNIISTNQIQPDHFGYLLYFTLIIIILAYSYSMYIIFEKNTFLFKAFLVKYVVKLFKIDKELSTPTYTKQKLLCILHLPPPAHGAAKVGEFIHNSQAINSTFDCHYIPIRSSDTIGDIGKVNFKKFYLVAELYIKVLWALIIFRPNKIYFTASIRSVAFYRDLLLSTLWKLYKKITPAEVYYHYHTKGIDDFISQSSRNLKLTRFFIDDIRLIVLSPLLAHDFARVQTYQSIQYLPNGIDDPLSAVSFETMLEKKYSEVSTIHILYLAHMMKDKGYIEALALASKTKGEPIHYHFAGSWQGNQDEKYFIDFVQKHSLENTVTYHGFVSGGQKKALLQKAHLLLYPSKNDAFPLTLLESLAYGVQVIATPEGSIPYMLDDQCAIIVPDASHLETALQTALTTFITTTSARYCRQRYLEYFNTQQFEQNFIRILND